MMKARGHHVTLYGGPENEADVDEHVVCITADEQRSFGFEGPASYLQIDFNAHQPWTLFSANVVAEIGLRIEPRDLICVITGDPTKGLAAAFPEHIVVEIGVGYLGICHRFRVFESHAWRSYVYGWHRVPDGAFFDEVIPNFYDVDDFPFNDRHYWSPDSPRPYFLYLGRLIDRKGWRIAQSVCEKTGAHLIVAGPGNFDGYGEYRGVAHKTLRGALLAGAEAVFVPTLYVPPFEGVHVEANLCGTPVITTDFGVFTETVANRDNGMRCRTEREFIEAMAWAREVDVGDRWDIRLRAQDRFSTDAIAPLYEAYFERLLTLYSAGWYA